MTVFSFVLLLKGFNSNPIDKKNNKQDAKRPIIMDLFAESTKKTLTRTI